MEDFLVKVAQVLEVDSVVAESDFRAIDGWCSLKAFGILVMLENDYGKCVAIDDFMRLRTVADLARTAGVA